MKKGFTLVELLAVIVILAIIAVIAVPSILGIIEKSREDAFRASVRNVFKAVELTIDKEVYSGKIDDLDLSEKIEGDWSYSSDNKTIKLCNVSHGKYKVVDGCIDKKDANKDFAITTSTNLDTSGANQPVLSAGMIPVYRSGSNWVKADATNSNGSHKWYDYSSIAKQWANAVTVIANGTKTREYYMNAVAGTIINQADINTMWVWIPRYKYAVPAGTTGAAREIVIVFENGLAKTGKGTSSPSSDTIADLKANPTNINYITHTAFKFGNDELAGIWVGKFETTGTIDLLTIKPGEPSLLSKPISDMFKASRIIQTKTYEYGFANDSDIHMMKNMEWGAVAYLSHSMYGILAEISSNGSSNFYTGGGAGNAYASNINQSTTGNIYGIYDMRGGAYEYVMGNYNNISGESGFLSLPNSKYYNLYTGNKGEKGDATNNDGTNGWYGDGENFLIDNYPWFVRGGYYSSGGSGAFYYSSNNGNGTGGVGTMRLVQVNP